VFVTLSTQHAIRMSHIVICGLSDLKYFSTLSHKTARFSTKTIHRTYNVCFDFLYSFVWNISHYKKNWGRCDQKFKLVFM